MSDFRISNLLRSMFPLIPAISVLGMSIAMSPVLLAADWQTIQKRGQLIVAVKEQSRPLGFRGADQQLQGFEIDIAQRLAQELLGKSGTVVLKPVRNPERLAAVMEGKVDVAIAQVTSTPGRSRLVSFSIPYYKDGIAILTRDAAVQNLRDLKKSTIAVLVGSNAVEIVKSRWSGATILPVASYEAARVALEQGSAIAFAGDGSVLAGWVQEFSGYRIVGETLTVQPLCIVIPKGLQYTELQTKINEIVLRWQRDGWLKERANYWGLP